jgi:protein TonB
MKRLNIITLLIITTTIYSMGQEVLQKNQPDSIKNESKGISADFPGGISEFYKYIQSNLKYPKSAKKEKVSGKVFVEFVINRDGTIEDETIRILTESELSNKVPKNVIITNHDCELEAIRLLQECPNWIPAQLDGKPSRQRMTLPITFRL